MRQHLTFYSELFLQKGVRLICNGCKLNHRSKIHHLGLSANEITDVGAHKIWHLVEKYSHSLTNVEMGFNPGIEDTQLLEIISLDCAKNKEFTAIKAWKHDTKNRSNRKRLGTVDMLSHSQIAEFKEAFRMFDGDNSGAIEKAELNEILHEIGHPVDEAMQNDMMIDADADGCELSHGVFNQVDNAVSLCHSLTF